MRKKYSTLLDTKIVATQNGFEFKLDICDVEMAKFFLGIPATSVSKLPLTKEIFKSDRNGFHNSILCADGTKWQQQRKRLSKMLHLDILNDYIEPMDISAVRFCEELCRDDGLKVERVQGACRLNSTENNHVFSEYN